MQLFGNKVIERFSLPGQTEGNKENQNISSLFDMTSLSNRNYDNPALSNEIHHFA